MTIYANPAEFKQRPIPVTDSYVEINSISADGVYTNAVYTRSRLVKPNHALAIQDADQVWWEIANNVITPHMGGATSNSLEDPKYFINALLAAAYLGKQFDGLNLNYLWNAAGGYNIVKGTVRAKGATIIVPEMKPNTVALGLYGQTANALRIPMNPCLALSKTCYVPNLDSYVASNKQLKAGGWIRIHSSDYWAKKISPASKRVQLGEWMQIDSIVGNTITFNGITQYDLITNPEILVADIVEGVSKISEFGFKGPSLGRMGTAESLALGSTFGLRTNYFESIIVEDSAAMAGFGSSACDVNNVPGECVIKDAVGDNGQMELRTNLAYFISVGGMVSKVYIENVKARDINHVVTTGSVEAPLELFSVRGIKGLNAHKAIADVHPSCKTSDMEDISGYQHESAVEPCVNSQAAISRVEGVNVKGYGAVMIQPFCTIMNCKADVSNIQLSGGTGIAVLVDLMYCNDMQSLNISGQVECKRGIYIKSYPWKDVDDGTVYKGGSILSLDISGSWESNYDLSGGGGPLTIDLRKSAGGYASTECPTVEDYSIRGKFVRTNQFGPAVQLYSDTGNVIRNGKFDCSIVGGYSALQNSLMSSVSISTKMIGQIYYSNCLKRTQNIYGSDLTANDAIHSVKLVAGI